MPLPPDGPFNWATNPAHPPGPAAWNGQPPRQTPSAGVQGTGFLPDTPFPLEFLNKILGNTGEWLQYLRDERNTLAAAVSVLQGQVASILARIVSDEWVYPLAKNRDHKFNIYSFTPSQGANPFTLGATGVNWTSTGPGAGRYLWIPFDFIPTAGAGFAGEINVTPGAVGVGANQVKFQLYRIDPMTGAQTAIGPITNSDGTINNQLVLWFSTSAVFVDRALYNYALRVEASSGGTTLVFGGRVAWTDAGPRNW